MGALIFCDSFMDSDILNRKDRNLSACLSVVFLKTDFLQIKCS